MTQDDERGAGRCRPRRRPSPREAADPARSTGDGKGKTTAALGTLLRARGRDMTVAMLQFLKTEGTRPRAHAAGYRLGRREVAAHGGLLSARQPPRDRHRPLQGPDRGGAFASLYGTWALLSAVDRELDRLADTVERRLDVDAVLEDALQRTAGLTR